jgi:cystathionine beta-lyase/cystathionine gamma-synthase
VDARETADVALALNGKTKLIVLESPNSMTLELQDLRAIATLAKSHGVLTLVDNSYSSPLLQNPIELGIDLVAHSLTKYINGHSDVVAGCVCGARNLIGKIFRGPFMTLGAVPSAFDAWLMLRGLRTLDVRLERINNSTMRIAQFLESHPQVSAVHYPSLPSHPQHDLARRQSKPGGGLLSIEVNATTVQQVEAFCHSLKMFLIACSWGGFESLQFPVVGLLRDGTLESNHTGMPFNLVRLSIGLENADELIADLDQALQAMHKR